MKFGITAALILMASMVLAQSQSQQPQPADPTAQAPTTKAPPPKTSVGSGGQTAPADNYLGEVILVDGIYYLRSGASQYKLDDQNKGKQFAGQTVQVAGSLDQQNVLHVRSITVH